MKLFLLLPFLALFVGVAELFFQQQGKQSLPQVQICIQIDPKVHHRYRANCRSQVSTDLGPIEYQFNEDGLRDRPRAVFTKGPGTIAVLGDSIVKGLFVKDDQTIPRLLEQRIGREMGRQFLNGGVRFSSPITQSLHFEKYIEPNYPIKGVLLLLNEGDPTDERFFWARGLTRDAAGVPTSFSFVGGQALADDNINRVARSISVKSRLLQFLMRLRAFLPMRRLVQQTPPTKEVLCGGINRLAARLRTRKIPLLVAFTPHSDEGIRRNWMGEREPPEHTDTIKACAELAGAKVVDLRREPIELSRYFEDQMHFNQAGSAWLIDALAKPVRDFFRPR